MSWRLYNMYSVYTVSERGVATVIKLCRDVCTICIRCIELVSERAVATVTDCVVTSVRYVFGVYS